jgi:hypothetical protein
VSAMEPRVPSTHATTAARTSFPGREARTFQLPYMGIPSRSRDTRNNGLTLQLRARELPDNRLI